MLNDQGTGWIVQDRAKFEISSIRNNDGQLYKARQDKDCYPSVGKNKVKLIKGEGKNFLQTTNKQYKTVKHETAVEISSGTLLAPLSNVLPMHLILSVLPG